MGLEPGSGKPDTHRVPSLDRLAAELFVLDPWSAVQASRGFDRALFPLNRGTLSEKSWLSL
jgi:hypothetical protein